MTKVLVSREESATSRTAPLAREALAIVPLVREIEDMQTVPFSRDELSAEPETEEHIRWKMKAEERGAVARVWHE